MILRTSQTDPLMIDAVAAPCGGLIGMTICPGKHQMGALSGDWRRDLELDLLRILEWGAVALVSLMENHEYRAYGVVDFPSRVPPCIRHYSLPIVDGGVPDAIWEESWQQVGRELRGNLRRCERIVIHCRGGLGRTGLVAARLLVELGMDPSHAILAVRQARQGTIENHRQEAYVRAQSAVDDEA